MSSKMQMTRNIKTISASSAETLNYRKSSRDVELEIKGEQWAEEKENKTEEHKIKSP